MVAFQSIAGPVSWLKHQTEQVYTYIHMLGSILIVLILDPDLVFLFSQFLSIAQEIHQSRPIFNCLPLRSDIHILANVISTQLNSIDRVISPRKIPVLLSSYVILATLSQTIKKV